MLKFSRLLLLGSASLIAISGAAFAADLRAKPYAKAPAYTPQAVVYNWTGFYVGGNVGGAFAGSDNFANGGTEGRFMGGVQAGADYQFSQNWVVGIEGQYSWLDRNNVTTTFADTSSLSTDNRGLGSVTGRLGYTWGPGLLYVKGGYAYADTNYNVALAGVAAPFATTGDRRNGYTVGAGLEYMFAPNWSAKVEYQYFDFGRQNFVAPSPAGLVTAGNFKTDDHTVKLGVNYRFGWGGPVVAKY